MFPDCSRDVPNYLIRISLRNHVCLVRASFSFLLSCVSHQLRYAYVRYHFTIITNYTLSP